MSIFEGRMSKGILFSLPEGGYLVSNIGFSPTDPVIAEPVVPLSDRNDQWQRMKERRADKCLYTLYPDRDAFLRSVETITTPAPRPPARTRVQRQPVIIRDLRELDMSRLTKTVYMSLPDGAFLSSGGLDSSGHPRFAEEVAPMWKREAQWEKIKSRRVDQRNFYLYPDKGSYAASFNNIRHHPLNKIELPE